MDISSITTSVSTKTKICSHTNLATLMLQIYYWVKVSRLPTCLITDFTGALQGTRWELTTTTTHEGPPAVALHYNDLGVEVEGARMTAEGSSRPAKGLLWIWMS